MEEVIIRLSRVGFDNIIGYLKGGYTTWLESGKETDAVKSISATELEGELKKEGAMLFDVRKSSEYLSEHVIDAENTPLDYMNAHMAEFKSEGTNYVHCAGGYRSMIACSILKSRGIHNLVDIAGGFGAIKETNIAVSDYVCPSTL